MAKNTSIDQLNAEIVKAVKEYTGSVSEGIEKIIDDTAKKVLKDIKINAPRDTGDYAKGLGITKQDNSTGVKRIIWNKKYGWKVHLLEFGHAKRRGGRVAGKAHFRPAYDKHVVNLNTRIKRVIQGGGIK